MKNRTETFDFGTYQVTRGECLRALVAAVYNTAKECSLFTTDDVFARLNDYPPYEFRKATAQSKLIAVALRKAAARGICENGHGLAEGGDVCHGRRKGVWVSKIADPQPALLTA